jgi:hypothetical protein
MTERLPYHPSCLLLRTFKVFRSLEPTGPGPRRRPPHKLPASLHRANLKALQSLAILAGFFDFLCGILESILGFASRTERNKVSMRLPHSGPRQRNSPDRHHGDPPTKSPRHAVENRLWCNVSTAYQLPL